MILPAPIQSLIDAFSRLPGIGPKTASRLTFFLLNAPDEMAQGLSEALHALKANTVDCPICFNVTSLGHAECEICASPERDASIVCVVEELSEGSFKFIVTGNKVEDGLIGFA